MKADGNIELQMVDVTVWLFSAVIENWKVRKGILFL